MFGLTAFAQSSFAALGGNTYLKDLTESISVSDSATNILAIPVSVSESIVVDATAYSVHALAAAIQESSSASDSFANTLLALAALNESIAISDTYQQLTGKFVYVTETAAIDDAVGAGGSIYNNSVNESADIQSFDSTGNIITANITENAVAAVATQNAILTLRPTITEALTVSDIYSSIAQMVAAINESSPIGATQAGNIVAYVDVAESSSVDASEIGAFDVSVLLTESVAATASQSSGLIGLASVFESAEIADNIAYTVDTKGIVTGILMTISLSAPLVWEQINDDQSPNWVEIKD